MSKVEPFNEDSIAKPTSTHSGKEEQEKEAAAAQAAMEAAEQKKMMGQAAANIAQDAAKQFEKELEVQERQRISQLYSKNMENIFSSFNNISFIFKFFNTSIC